jgi:hypothetical protein
MADKLPLAALITKQHIPWCAECARHHHGQCENVDVPRDNAPTVNVNMRKDDDDDGSVSVVTDGSTARTRRTLGRRVETFALGDMVITRADGTRTVVPKRKRGETDRKRAKVAREAALATEAIRLGEKLTMDEKRRLNGTA